MLSVCRRPQLFKPFVAAGRASSNRALHGKNTMISYCAEQTTERGKKQPRNRQIRLSSEYAFTAKKQKNKIKMLIE
jgi:hypothetical protein